MLSVELVLNSAEVQVIKHALEVHGKQGPFCCSVHLGSGGDINIFSRLLEGKSVLTLAVTSSERVNGVDNAVSSTNQSD